MKLVAYLFISLFLSLIYFAYNLNYFSIEVNSLKNQRVEVFYQNVAGHWKSKWIVINEGKNQVSEPIGLNKINQLRIDPELNLPIQLKNISVTHIFTKLECESRDVGYKNQGDIKIENNIINFIPELGSNDPYFSIACNVSHQLTPYENPFFISSIYLLIGIFSFLIFFDFLFNYLIRKKIISKILIFFKNKPLQAILLVSLIATSIACNQVIFNGKSFVAPLGTSLIFADNPPLPSYSFKRIYDYHGSDTGATMWQHFPYSKIQGDSLRKDGEIALWNRFNGAGRTLIGQGQAMIADPINMIVSYFGANALSLDIKYVLLRFIFTISVGISVFFLTSSLKTANVIAFASPFVTFFLYRLNHPGYFTFCYAATVLLAWIIISKSRESVLGYLFLILSNWLLINSGTGKEAYILLVFNNLFGFILLNVTKLEWSEKKSKLISSIVTMISFILISSPLWFTFLSTILKETSGYHNPAVWQFSILDIFKFADNISFVLTKNSYWPAVNYFFFILFILYFILLIKKDLKFASSHLVFILYSMLCISFAFGIIPASLILKMPFLNSIHHINGTFLTALVVPFIFVASFVLKNLFELDEDIFKRYLKYAALLIAILALPILFVTKDAKFLILFLCVTFPAFFYLIKIYKQIFIYEKVTVPSILILLISIIFLFGRGAQWPDNGFGISKVLFVPSARADLIPQYPLFDKLNTLDRQPFRSISLESTLFSGYRSVYGFESIDGPDALYPARYRKLQEAMKLPYTEWNWRLKFEGNIEKYSNYLNFLNVKYVFSEKNLDHIYGEPFLKDDRIFVYIRKHVWPRAFFTNKVIPFEDNEMILLKALNAQNAPFIMAENKFLESLNDHNKYEFSVATDYLPKTNSVDFTFENKTPGFVYLGNNFDSNNFYVTLDGKVAEPFLANYTFMGLYVEKIGKHHVHVMYWPQFMSLLLKISLFGMLLMTSLLIWLLHKRKVKFNEI